MKDSTVLAGARIRTVGALAAFSALAAAFALDNTINNDFWNTTGYVNPSPDTKAFATSDAKSSRTSSSTRRIVRHSRLANQFTRPSMSRLNRMCRSRRSRWKLYRSVLCTR